MESRWVVDKRVIVPNTMEYFVEVLDDIRNILVLQTVLRDTFVNLLFFGKFKKALVSKEFHYLHLVLGYRKSRRNTLLLPLRIEYHFRFALPLWANSSAKKEDTLRLKTPNVRFIGMQEKT
jgi:hypothetical protein